MTKKTEKPDVKALEEQLRIAEQKNNLLQENLESVYAELRTTREQRDKLLHKINEDIAYITKTTAVFAESIYRVTKGENNGN